MTDPLYETKEYSLKSFWVVLEFRISGELYDTTDEGLKDFWCDGIYLSPGDPQLEKKNVNDKRKIHLTAWLGKTGQDQYEATIHFGPKALSRYARNLPLEESIPDYEVHGPWFEIDPKRKTIEIQLR